MNLGIDSHTPAGKLIISLFSPFNQDERENNREKSLAGIDLAKQQGKHLGRPTGRDAVKLAKVQQAFKAGLTVSQLVKLTGISLASIKYYCKLLGDGN